MVYVHSRRENIRIKGNFNLFRGNPIASFMEITNTVTSFGITSEQQSGKIFHFLQYILKVALIFYMVHIVVPLKPFWPLHRKVKTVVFQPHRVKSSD